MRIAAVLALAAVSVLAPGCSAVIGSLHECDQDSDCAGRSVRGMSCQSSLCALPAVAARCVQLGDTTDQAMVFGLILPKTNADGTPHAWGPAWENSVQLVVDEINASLASRPIQMLSCDTASDSATAKAEAQYLIDFGVPAIIADGSADTLAESDLTIPAGVLLLAGAATSPGITGLYAPSPDGSVRLVWRTTPSDVLQAKVIAQELTPESGAPPSVAVFERHDTYGQGLYTAFSKAYTGTQRGFLFEPITDASDPSQQPTQALQEAAAMTPQVAVLIGYPADVTSILNGADAMASLHSVSWFFTQGAKFDGLFASLNDEPQVEGSRGTAPASASPTSEAFAWFQQFYKQRFGSDPSNVTDTANMFDAAMLLAVAATSTTMAQRDLTGTDLAQVLTRVSDATATPIALTPVNFAAILGLLQTGKPVNIDGASGHLDFDPAVGEAPADIELWKIQDKSFVTVKTVSP